MAVRAFSPVSPLNHPDLLETDRKEEGAIRFHVTCCTNIKETLHILLRHISEWGTAHYSNTDPELANDLLKKVVHLRYLASSKTISLVQQLDHLVDMIRFTALACRGGPCPVYIRNLEPYFPQFEQEKLKIFFDKLQKDTPLEILLQDRTLHEGTFRDFLGRQCVNIQTKLGMITIPLLGIEFCRKEDKPYKNRVLEEVNKHLIPVLSDIVLSYLSPDPLPPPTKEQQLEDVARALNFWPLQPEDYATPSPDEE